jgi:hypothetical protein
MASSLISIFSIYAVDYDGDRIIQFTLQDSQTSFFSAIKTAVDMSVGLEREFVVVNELSNGIDRFSKTNHRSESGDSHPNRSLDFREICLKNCYHAKAGRFHFQKMMMASPVLRQTLYLDSILFPGFALTFPRAAPMFA